MAVLRLLPRVTTRPATAVPTGIWRHPWGVPLVRTGVGMGLKEVWGALRRAWWLPFLGLITAVGGGLAISHLETPRYWSSTQLFVSTPAAASHDIYQGGLFAVQRVTSYSELIEGEAFAARVVDRLDLPMAPEELSDRITVSVPTESVLINITVSDPSPQQAQRIAGAIGTEFVAMAAEVEQLSSGATSPVRVSITEPPRLPTSASYPDLVRRLSFAALVGLVLGASAAIARARLDPYARNPEEITGLTGAPVIATIRRDKAVASEHVIPLTGSSPTAEDYRQLRSNLQLPEQPCVLLVASAGPDEGKATLTINLGLALAEIGKRVAIVEADLRHPKLSQRLDLAAETGLSDVLDGRAALNEVVLHYTSGVTIVPSGPQPSNPGELLASKRMRTVMEKLRAENDVVLVQGPPLLTVADSSSLTLLCDGVLLSVRFGRTRKDQVRRAVETLDRVGACAISIVLNIVPRDAELLSDYRYGPARDDRAPLRRRPAARHGTYASSPRDPYGNNGRAVIPTGAAPTKQVRESELTVHPPDRSPSAPVSGPTAPPTRGENTPPPSATRG